MLKKQVWRDALNLEGGIGFQYETFFNCKRNHFALSLMYEVVEWYNQNQLVDMPTGIGALGATTQLFEFRNGNLTLQGVTLRTDFHF